MKAQSCPACAGADLAMPCWACHGAGSLEASLAWLADDRHARVMGDRDMLYTSADGIEFRLRDHGDFGWSLYEMCGVEFVGRGTLDHGSEDQACDAVEVMLERRARG